MLETTDVQFHLNECVDGRAFYARFDYKTPQPLVSALEAVYAANFLPAGNPILSKQRALGNAFFWDNRFFGSPLVQGCIDGRGLVLFDHRVVDAEDLSRHPLQDPAYLKESWEKIEYGRIPVPSVYFDDLVSIAADENSGVYRLDHVELSGLVLNQDIFVPPHRDNIFIERFLALPKTLEESYWAEHKKRRPYIFPYLGLEDATQEAQIGRLSVFGSDKLSGYDLYDSSARLFGVPASVSAEGASKENSVRGV